MGKSRVATMVANMKEKDERNLFTKRQFGIEYRIRENDLEMTIDLLDFEGHEFIQWLTMVEHNFEYKDIPQERRVELAAIKLKKICISVAGEPKANPKCMRQHEGNSKITI